MKLQDVKKGDVLMLFDSYGHSFGGATSHTLTVSPEYTEIQCKDCGQFPWKKLSKVNWEISTENLYVASEYVAFLNKALADTEIDVIFGESNWSADGLGEAAYYTTYSGASMLYTGKVKISSLTLNAASGENANYSATFTGSGNFAPVTNSNL